MVAGVIAGISNVVAWGMAFCGTEGVAKEMAVSDDSRCLEDICALEDCGFATVFVVLACGANVCATVCSADLGVVVEAWRAADSFLEGISAIDGCSAMMAVAFGCGTEICITVGSVAFGVAVGCNDTGLSARFVVSVNGRGVMDSEDFAVAIRGTVVVVSFGATTELWPASSSRDSRVSSGSRASRISRFLAVACDIVGCSLAMVAVACCCCAESCAAVFSTGIGIAIGCNSIGLSAGFAVAMEGTTVVFSLGTIVEDLNSRDSKDSRDSRFLAVACGIVGCVLVIVAVACVCDAGICVAVASAGVAVAVELRLASGSRDS